MSAGSKGRNGRGYCPFPALGRDPGVLSRPGEPGVRRPGTQARRAAERALARQHDLVLLSPQVAISSLCLDMAGAGIRLVLGRDMNLMS